MREASATFWLLAIFFTPVAIVYSFWTGWSEPVGTTGLFFLVAMNAMAAWYLGSARKKLDNDPADNPRGDIADGAGDFGFFSPGSAWPIMLAFGAALLFAGLAVGWWLFLVGVVIGLVALLGWSFEYFRGDII